MKLYKKFVFLLFLGLSFSCSFALDIDKTQVQSFVQSKIDKNGQQRTQQAIDKISQKLESLTGEKQEVAKVLLEVLQNSLDAGENTKIIKREDVDKSYKWDLTQIYTDLDEWQKDYKKAGEMIGSIGNYKGKLNNDSSLLEYLKSNDEISQLTDKLDIYVSLWKSIDNKNVEIDKLSQQINSLYSQYNMNTAFFKVEIKNFDDEKLNSLINNKDFINYKSIFQKIKNKKPYILSQREEDLIAKFSDSYIPFSSIYDALIDGDITYPQITDPNGNKIMTNYANMYSAWNNYDRNFRKEYTEKFYNKYREFKNTLGALFVSHIKEATADAKARGYDSVLAVKYLNNNLSTKIYDNLINVANKDLDTFHRYIKLRKEYLGLEGVHYYDIFVSLEKYSQNGISYEESKNMILNGLSKLGTDYISGLNKAFNNNWIDVYQSDNKGGGAFCTSIYLSHPFLLINFNNTIDDMSSLAHELGHAMNFYFTSQKQPYSVSNPSYPVEVPSISNELILFRGLADRATSDKDKLYYLDRYLSILNLSFRRAAMYGEFERSIYDKAWSGEALSYQTLDSKFEELFKKYYGPDFVRDEYLDIERAIKPHFFSTYYTHEYAISAAIANQIAINIYNDKAGFTGEYINFISQGSSKTPAETLKEIGIDINNPSYIESVSDTENEIMNEMEIIINKLKDKK